MTTVRKHDQVLTPPSAPRGRLSRRSPRRGLATIVLLLTACLLVAGCGKSSSTTSSSTSGTTTTSASSDAGAGTTDSSTCPTSNTTAFAKSKFVLHVGLAFGTFHRYIYKPLKAHGFSAGAPHRVSTFVKAGATALFDKREIRLAAEDVKANPTLCKTLAAPLGKLADAFGGLTNKIKGGDPTAADDVNAQIADISSKSANGGAAITERTDESAG